MARVKIQVERGKGLTQTVVIDTSATVGATLGSNVFLNGQVATPAAVLAWLGNPGSGGGSAAGGRPLTSSNDTNVTLSLGGAPGSALITAASINAGWVGQLSAPRGGTGFGSYAAGDLLYASGTTTLAKLGVGSAGDILRVSGGAPAWQAPANLGANPSASFGVNLAGANGSASTFLRSDAVLKLDQSISPVWTGVHKFTGTVDFDITQTYVQPGKFGSSPRYLFVASTGATDEKIWTIEWLVGSKMAIRGFKDDLSDNRQAWAAYRNGTGVAINTIEYGNPTDNPPHTFYGQLVPNGQSLSTGASIPSIGANKPGSAVSLTPSTWWGIVVNGTQYYIPLWI